MIDTVNRHYLFTPGEDMLSPGNRDQQSASLSYTAQPVVDPDDVAANIGDLRRTSFELAREIEHAVAAGHGPEIEHAILNLEGIDNAVSRIARKAARAIGKDRERSIAMLNAVFAQGEAPTHPLSGDYRGELLATTVRPSFDAVARLVSQIYMPWVGKRFDPDTETGVNVLVPSARFFGHIVWPFYFRYKRYHDRLYTGFSFDTFIAPSVQNPDIMALKLDYDKPQNPDFLVRTVLDEIVQITHNYYLGRSFLWRSGEFHLVGYFALRDESSKSKVQGSK